MSPPPSNNRTSFVGNLAASAFSASFAEACTIPIDTAKVRLQLQGAAAAGAKPKYNGMFGTMATVAKEEGFGALWKGITPGIHRQILFGGLRIGLYEPVKNFYCGPDHVVSDASVTEEKPARILFVDFGSTRLCLSGYVSSSFARRATVPLLSRPLIIDTSSYPFRVRRVTSRCTSRLRPA